MTDALAAPASRGDIYRIRMRILKLRWLGMEDEADRLAAICDAPPHAEPDAALPPEYPDTD